MSKTPKRDRARWDYAERRRRLQKQIYADQQKYKITAPVTLSDYNTRSIEPMSEAEFREQLRVPFKRQ